MKRITFFKSLLLAAGLSVGASAWGATGDVTKNVDIDFSNSITGNNPYTITGSVGSMTWTRQWTYAPSISSDGQLLFGNMDSNPLSGAIVELQNANIGSKDKVTISFELAFSKLSGKHVGFQLLDANNNSLLQQWFDAYNADFDDANPLNLSWDNMYHGQNTILWERRVYFTIVFDYAAKKVTTSTQCYLSGAGKARTDATVEAAWTTTTPIAKFVLQGNLNNGDRPSAFDNLKITTTEGDYSVADANYTVKYKCGSEEIKVAEVRSGSVGSSISLFTNDKENFTSGEKRYIYVSDDAEGKTIASDGSTVVTVTFREAAKYNYTVTSSYSGKTLDFGFTGSVWEDQNGINIVYPRFQVYDNNTLVGKGPNGNDLQQSASITENNQKIDLEYSALNPAVNDLLFFSEAENIEGLTASYPSGLGWRVSNKGIAIGTSGKLLKLPAGRYKITVGLCGGAGNIFTVAVKAGEDEIISGTCNANTIQMFTSQEFTLTEGSDITFTNTQNNSGRGIDFVYVQGAYTNEIVGAIDCSSAYWGPWNTTPIWINAGETGVYKFVNYNKGEGDLYCNWYLFGATEGSENIVQFGPDHSNTATNSTYVSKPEFTMADLNGATIEVNTTLTKDTEGDNYTLTSTAVTTKSDGTKLSPDLVYKQTGITASKLKLYVTTEQSWLELLSEDIVVPVTNGYATFANHNQALDFSNVEGLKAYTATLKDANTVTFTPATKVPAGTGLLLKGATANVPVIASATAIDNNVLYAPTTAVSGLTYDDGTYYNYILTSKNNKVGFYQANSNTVAVGKAYLRVAQAGLARELTFIGFDDDNTTTGIDNVNVIVNDNNVFDLQGRRVNQPVKGMYIVNGKKVIFK